MGYFNGGLKMKNKSNIFQLGYNVGVNTTTPQNTLNVKGNSNTTNVTYANITIIQNSVALLPACSAAFFGGLGRNSTGLYYCSNTSAWKQLVLG